MTRLRKLLVVDVGDGIHGEHEIGGTNQIRKALLMYCARRKSKENERGIGACTD